MTSFLGKSCSLGSWFKYSFSCQSTKCSSIWYVSHLMIYIFFKLMKVSYYQGHKGQYELTQTQREKLKIFLPDWHWHDSSTLQFLQLWNQNILIILVWCSNIQPKLKKLWNSTKNQSFFDAFWRFFEVHSILAHY